MSQLLTTIQLQRSSGTFCGTSCPLLSFLHALLLLPFCSRNDQNISRVQWHGAAHTGAGGAACCNVCMRTPGTQCGRSTRTGRQRTSQPPEIHWEVVEEVLVVRFDGILSSGIVPQALECELVNQCREPKWCNKEFSSVDAFSVNFPKIPAIWEFPAGFSQIQQAGFFLSPPGGGGPGTHPPRG